jgi:tellurite methyltransferase
MPVSRGRPGTEISPFIGEWIARVARELGVPATPCRALDLAMGEGRHTRLLASTGFIAFGVDLSVERLATARSHGRDTPGAVHQWAADLDTYPLPVHYFDVLLVSRFLLRARWTDLKRLVVPGGFVVYETFTVGQLAKGTGPSAPEHLLNPGELVDAFADWRVLFSEEIDEPAAVARLVARKPACP